MRLGSRTLQPRRQLLADGERVPLGKRALDILSVLAEAGNQIVTKDELLGAVWPGVIVEENALQVHIVALRKALGPDAERLKTIRGVGYQLVVDASSIGGAEMPGGSAGDMLVGAPSPGQFESPAAEASPAVPRLAPRRPMSRRTAKWIAAAIAAAMLVAALWAFAPRLGLGPKERIAVVVRPLSGIGGPNSGAAALASGITDELVVRLRHIPDLRIATAEPDGAMPSEAFRQAYVVDGSIRSSGQQLRVTARLLGQDGEVLWSQTFDRPFADLFNVQEDIAAAIANALSVSFDVGGNSADYGGTNNPEAYAAYMQAYLHQLDPSFDGIPFLQRAVDLDPHYAKARNALYGDYGLQISYAPPGDKKRVMGELDVNTREALAANPDLWIPEAARAMYDVYRHDFVTADRRFARVLQLDKGVDPELRSKTANYHMLLGRVRKAVALRQSNQIIDPVQRNDPFGIYDREMLGQYRESIALFDRLDKQGGERSLAGFVSHAFWSRLLVGDEAEALAFARGHGEGALADTYVAIKNDPKLPAMTLAQLKQWSDQRHADSSEFDLAIAALFASHAGKAKLAVDLLRLAFDQPSGGALWTLWHPAVANARKTPEFRRLVTDLGMVKAWRASKDWGDYCKPVSASDFTCT